MGLSKFREVQDSGKVLAATERKLGSMVNIKKLRDILDMRSEKTTTVRPSPSPSPNSKTVAVDNDGFHDFPNMLSARSDSTIAYQDEADSTHGDANDKQQSPSGAKT